MTTRRDPTRREALQIIGAAGAATIGLPLGASPQLRVFTVAENRLVSVLADHIIPADARSPGAAAAGVSEFIDRLLGISPATTVDAWREGLRAIDALSVERFGARLLEASRIQQVSVLTDLSRNERQPVTEAERFFCRLKYATIDAYYTSRIGIERELGRQAGVHLDRFPGCAHQDHG